MGNVVVEVGLARVVSVAVGAEEITGNVDVGVEMTRTGVVVEEGGVGEMTSKVVGGVVVKKMGAEVVDNRAEERSGDVMVEMLLAINVVVEDGVEEI